MYNEEILEMLTELNRTKPDQKPVAVQEIFSTLPSDEEAVQILRMAKDHVDAAIRSGYEIFAGIISQARPAWWNKMKQAIAQSAQ